MLLKALLGAQGAIGLPRTAAHIPPLGARLVHLDAALDGAQVLRVPPVLRDQPLLVRRAAADDAALREALLLLPHHRVSCAVVTLLEFDRLQEPRLDRTGTDDTRRIVCVRSSCCRAIASCLPS